LHNESCHPRNTKLAVQHGTALRLRRICSSDKEFEQKSVEYKAYLASRGHNPMEITNAFNKVKNISRNDARTKSSGSKEGEKRHRFFTKFNPHHPNVLRIIKKHEHLLQTNATLAKLFPQGSFQVVNKREKNLKELIARADPYCVNQKSVGKYSTCEKVRCDSCNIFAQECTKFKCQATGRQYMINKKMSCNTPNVIYLAQCEKCKVQGVGSTTK